MNRISDAAGTPTRSSERHWGPVSIGWLILAFCAFGPQEMARGALQAGEETPQRIAVALPGSPQIDGELDEVWQQVPLSRIDRPVTSMNDPRVERPANGSFRALWDERHLYVLVKVLDEQIGTGNEAPWERDSIEVFVDERLDRATSFQADDGQYRIDANGNVSYGDAGLFGNVQAAVARESDGYLVEIAIELAKVELAAGRQLGWELQINSDDGLGRRQTLMKWNSPTNRSWRDPSTFGTLICSTPERLEADLAKAGEGERAMEEGAAADSGEAATRIPEWAADAIFYQLFPERFRNGDPDNDPTRESLEFPEIIPSNWSVTPWTAEWYARADWERAMGDDFYEHGVFHRRYGGDLQGVLDKLDYLEDLGINVIYFNPVFYARSLHKYDGNSFHHVDPYFGPDPAGDFALVAKETADPATWQWTAADRLFLKVVAEAHRRGIRVIVDGVFNHTGRDFFAFADIVRRGPDSPYVDWYTIEAWDDPATPENEFKYRCWWGVDTLPEFADNAAGDDLHPAPRAYVMNATRRWMDPNADGDPSDGIDGWRLDVANEVPNGFWRDWNALVRKLNPEAFTVAEIWEDAGAYLVDCGFSSTMNYHGFAFPVKGFLVDGRMTGEAFARELQERMEAHPPRGRTALQNLLDSHDTDRIASMIVNARQSRPYQNGDRFDYDVGERVSARWFSEYDTARPTDEDRRLQRLVALFQMTFVGAPMIYYGTESGMDGADDPDDRMPMIWSDLDYEPRTRGPRGSLETPEPVAFDAALYDWYRTLIRLRRDHPVLRRGSLEFVHADPKAPLLVFARKLDEAVWIVAINRDDRDHQVALDNAAFGGDRNWERVISSVAGEAPPTVVSAEGRVEWNLPRRSGAVWKLNPAANQ